MMAVQARPLPKARTRLCASTREAVSLRVARSLSVRPAARTLLLAMRLVVVYPRKVKIWKKRLNTLVLGASAAKCRLEYCPTQAVSTRLISGSANTLPSAGTANATISIKILRWVGTAASFVSCFGSTGAVSTVATLVASAAFRSAMRSDNAKLPAPIPFMSIDVRPALPGADRGVEVERPVSSDRPLRPTRSLAPGSACSEDRLPVLGDSTVASSALARKRNGTRLPHSPSGAGLRWRTGARQPREGLHLWTCVGYR
mmetsp:Transcript_4005/g.10309  ORF Transcript_4005/g.10309 Transcript_4005/m.10309 type:complete len:258 (+) Transcript_4005:379-1152(+)